MRVLITGAVEGLGRALAENLLKQGHSVVAVDHNRDGLHELTQSHIGKIQHPNRFLISRISF